MDINIADRQLWGNEAAEDESYEVLNQYFVTRPEWGDYFSLNTPFQVVRSKKGMGKSALLREISHRTKLSRSALVIEIKGSDITPVSDTSPEFASERIHDWQQRICSQINRHLGTMIGFAWNDVQMTLVDIAELSDMKSKNLVGSLIERLKGKLGPLELQKAKIDDHIAILKRSYSEVSQKLLLVVDDIDATFTNTKEERERIATFLTACRELATQFGGLVIRTSIRSDVWAMVAPTDEALDKVRQYIVDIKWSRNTYAPLLAFRIKRYLIAIGYDPSVETLSNVSLIEIIFEKYFPWGSGKVHPNSAIYSLSLGRPRWAVQLCRMAGMEAQRGCHKIKAGHFNGILEKYGSYRLDDLVSEYRNQCPELQEILQTFAGRGATFTTKQLLLTIKNHLSALMPLQINGYPTEQPLPIAKFLFQIGFLQVSKTDGDGQMHHYDFDQKPNLLTLSSNLDAGMIWRVPQLFARALQFKNMDETFEPIDDALVVR